MDRDDLRRAAKAAREVDETLDRLQSVNPGEEVHRPIQIMAGLFFGGLGLLLAGVGVMVAPAAVRDIVSGRPDAWTGTIFMLSVFLLPGLFALYVSARLLLGRGKTQFLPWWMWRGIAVFLALVALVMVYAVLTGAVGAAAPGVAMAWFGWNAWRLSLQRS